jgi:hypothetical protein
MGGGVRDRFGGGAPVGHKINSIGVWPAILAVIGVFWGLLGSSGVSYWGLLGSSGVSYWGLLGIIHYDGLYVNINAQLH